MTSIQKLPLVATVGVLLLWANIVFAQSTPSKGRTTSTAIRAGREAMIRDTTPACHAASRYVAMVNEGKLGGLGSLFADTVDYTGPDGKHRSTRAEVEAMYAGYAKATSNRSLGFELFSLTPVGADECLMEFGITERNTGSFVLAAVEHVFVGRDGKINRFVPYFNSATRDAFQALINGH